MLKKFNCCRKKSWFIQFHVGVPISDSGFGYEDPFRAKLAVQVLGILIPIRCTHVRISSVANELFMLFYSLFIIVRWPLLTFTTKFERRDKFSTRICVQYLTHRFHAEPNNIQIGRFASLFQFYAVIGVVTCPSSNSENLLRRRRPIK